MRFPPLLVSEFYQRPTEVVARELLGKLVFRKHEGGQVVVRLTEVEAYLGVDDPACHTFGGRRTARTESMWGPAGRAYVYLVYGLHHCLNVVTVGEGTPEAVLIRGAEILQGHEIIRRRRGPTVQPHLLTNGPGKLCQALDITRAENDLELFSSASGLSIRDDGFKPMTAQIHRSARIGVGSAGEAASWPLRYVMESSV